MRSERADADLLAESVLAAPPRLGSVRVLAIDGPSGAGKSTLARDVVCVLRTSGVTVAMVSTDDFATWDVPVAWWPRLVDGVLEPFAAGRACGYRRMDWTGGVPRLGEWVRVPVPDVLVLEGVSAGRASVRRRLSALCWVGGPRPAERLERAVARDGESARSRLRDWQRFEHGWFAVDRTAHNADRAIGLVQSERAR
ncbi:energy-coupling factor transporter ATP-binding protein EcfA2 [Saccharomonospora amisosensis]|uniref:Energy-coupling factor transporter ATP-binding protein EcfA2 n=1 Tax=Saccharomonospora amisosensis TaxID=1128677 RepID=A0A7X5ULP2_9PSEU|nr:uridine kinase [Saccharomonospora amisosensis]NIJ09989.1 energy-coupling factor transporter ATP-binding protein EcfA2 [Saccharomonospora amisosensis]